MFFKTAVLFFFCISSSLNTWADFDFSSFINGYYSRPSEISSSLPKNYKKLSLEEILSIAEVYKDNGNIDNGLSVLEAVEKKFSKNKDYLFYLGRFYLLSGYWDKAVKILSTLPAEPRILFYLGFAYEMLGNPKSLKTYLRCWNLAKSQLYCLQRVENIYFSKERNYSQAYKYQRILCSLDRFIPFLAKRTAISLFWMGDYKLSYKYLEKALGISPADEEARKYLSRTRRRLGKSFFEKKKEQIKIAYKKPSPSPGYLKQWDKFKDIRVRLIKNCRQIKFKSSADFDISINNQAVFSGKKGRVYTVYFKRGVFLLKNGIILLSKLQGNLLIKNNVKNSSFTIFDVDLERGSLLYKHFVRRAFRGKFYLFCRQESFDLINILKINEYLYSVLPSEMPYYWPQQALKAQAVVARTLAWRRVVYNENKPYDLDSNTSSQVYSGISAEKKNTVSAVDQTKGEVILYNNQPIEALYHSNSSGYTQADIFSSESGYLKPVLDGPPLKEYPFPLSPYRLYKWFWSSPDVFCNPENENFSAFRWSRIFSARQIQDFLNSYFSENVGKIKNIRILKRSISGHIQKIKISSAAGEFVLKNQAQIRKAFGGLRSSAFVLDIVRDKNKKPLWFILKGGGFGHGVGLSQYGAKGMAEQGYNYKDIIKHYYRGVEIRKVY